MIFVDASALCAILLGEPEGDDFAARIGAAESKTSAIAVFETVAAVARVSDGDIAAARRDVDEFLEVAGLQMLSIGAAELAHALDAFDRYGKGRHPAQLNLGDCFAYGCARANGLRLLFKGADFSRTDILAAP